MCRCMAQNNLNLIKARNKDGETPLFLAVLHGKASAFLDLHRELRKTGGSDADDIIHCRRNDGDTILHVAIGEEYYDLAYDIIQKYPVLVDRYNTNGQSALHLLATHPSSFKSGSNLIAIEKLIYKCMIVYPLKLETTTFKDEIFKPLFKAPGNYQTITDFFKLLWNIIGIFVALMPQVNINKAKGANTPDASSTCAAKIVSNVPNQYNFIPLLTGSNFKKMKHYLGNRFSGPAEDCTQFKE
ncbi:uncharacterized protein LOC131217511 [Magnolia sinica]|uniref:uncharacterized protein LOC131217511 n=1 Tax=Magnolia sinica TaxID=86752 RepID=UPI00265B1B5B|nr:uncharacterized protein LOC131217511 [Magnolia sinica]